MGRNARALAALAAGGFVFATMNVGVIEAVRAQQVTFPAAYPPNSPTVTPADGQLTIPPPPAPLPQPDDLGTGKWTFGLGLSPSASVSIPALDPRLGRILQYSLGGSSNYQSLNAFVDNVAPTTPPGQNIAQTFDTLTVSGGGLSTTGTNGVYFYCVYSPCVSSQQFVNANVDQSVGTPFVYSANLPYFGNATNFVQQNQALYGAQTISLKMTTSVQNYLGDIQSYSVTSQYQAGLSRAYVPWTTDDIVAGTILPGATTGQKIGVGELNITPTPQLGFTAQQAAALSGFTNFNYLQEYTASGHMNFTVGNKGALQNPVITQYVNTPGQPLVDLPPGDTRVIGDIDPLIGGNQGRPADQFDLYYDQTQVPAPSNPNQVSNNVFSPSVNFGLNFGDNPNLSWRYSNSSTFQGVGDFLAFQTELVGVTMQNMSDGSTTVTYSPLTSSVDGSLDQSTIFNWMWVQFRGDDACGVKACGSPYIITAGGPDPNAPPDGEAFFLGFGVMDESQIEAAIDETLSAIGADYSQSFGASAVPEPSTWSMMLFGFAGLGFAWYRKAKNVHLPSDLQPWEC